MSMCHASETAIEAQKFQTASKNLLCFMKLRIWKAYRKHLVEHQATLWQHLWKNGSLIFAIRTFNADFTFDLPVIIFFPIHIKYLIGPHWKNIPKEQPHTPFAKIARGQLLPLRHHLIARVFFTQPKLCITRFRLSYSFRSSRGAAKRHGVKVEPACVHFRPILP